ncbi:hypothetical protein ACWDTD_18750 [Gordonia sp. NPDC003425]
MSSLNLGRFGRITFTRPTADADVDTLDTEVGTPDAEVGTLDTEPGTLDADVGTLDTEAGTLDTEVGTLDAEAGTLDTEVGTPDAEVGTLDAEEGGSRWRKPAIAGAAVLTIAAVAGGVVLGVSNHGRAEVRDSEDGMKSAVTRQVVNMLSYDHATIDKQMSTAAEGLTPTFRSDFTKLADQVVIPGAKEKQVDTKVTVAGNSVVSLTADRAQLLLLLNQTTSSAAEKNPSTAGSRVIVTAIKSGDRWLIDSLQPV